VTDGGDFLGVVRLTPTPRGALESMRAGATFYDLTDPWLTSA
jgi:hypothetical protein